MSLRTWKRRAKWLERRLGIPLLDFLLPTDCFACGERLLAGQRRGACCECWSALRPIVAPFCLACGDPLPAATDLLGPAAGRCPACVLRPGPLARTRAAVAYAGAARAFVLRAKAGLREELLRDLGARLGALLAAEGFADACDAVVPVPSHPWVRLRRGFDPAREVARGLRRHVDLPLRWRWLWRRLPRALAAKRLGRRGRDAAVRDAFRASPAVRGARVLLVDDVRTTGATLAACAKALAAAGAGEVRAAVFATTPRHGYDSRLP